MFFDSNLMNLVSFGKVSIKRAERGFWFSRFTDIQMEIWNEENPYFNEKFFDGYFYRNSIAGAGIKLDFITNSEWIKLNIAAIEAVNETKDNVLEVFVNRKKVADIIEHGKYEFKLGKQNRVQIFFPYFAQVYIKSIEVEDDSVIEPYEHKLRWLCIGDSITQGVGASMPTLNYPLRISSKYDIEVINQGNSGYVTDERIISRIDNWEPDIVTSAYGINDVGRKTLEQQESEFYAYCNKLKREFPNSKIYIISPIWGEILFGANPSSHKRKAVYRIFDDVTNIVGINLIDGLKLVPHNKKYYLPDGNHPNDLGYRHYASRLGKILFSDLG